MSLVSQPKSNELVRKVFWRFWPRLMVYGPGPYTPGPYGPEPFVICNLKEFLSQIYSRTIIFEMHTAPEACLLYAPEAVCISNMVLEHSSRSLMVLDHKLRPKSQKKREKMNTFLAKCTNTS